MGRTKLSVLIMIMLFVISTFIGCSKSGSSGDTGQPRADGAGGTEGQISGFNETGYPIVNEKITLTMMGADTADPRRKWEENRFFKRMEEMTSIHFKFIQIARENWNEKKKLAFASGDLPDVFFSAFLTAQEEMSYGEQGILIPLEGMIEKYAPNIKKCLEENPGVKKSITLPSGNIVALPAIHETKSNAHIYLNKKWMDELGLEEPNTVDDLYKILKAFKDQDPNKNGMADEIPLSLVGVAQIKPLMSAWGLLFNDVNLFIDDNNKVVFSPIQPEFKDALVFLKKLYDEKLLDNETFTQTTQQLNAKGRNDTELLGGFYTAGAFTVVGEARHFDYITMIPLLTPKGQRMWPLDGTFNDLENKANAIRFMRGTFAITNKCKAPEAMIRWVDYLYTEEGAILTWMGKEGEEYEWNSDGTWSWILEEGQEQYDVRYPGTIAPATVPGLRPDNVWFKLGNIYESSLWPIRGRVNKYDRLTYPFLYFPVEKQKRVNSLNADIGSYVDQMIARFITGDASIDEWDNYVKTIQNMGVEELISIYQEAYDEFIKE
ncbi:MAG: extracellular solute-binding protein [Clostridiales bacterium]|jgi:putative aldouronate transport system substrate-binding protein|nr:extracellular solute-binding protein [Clostridiales bacterium]